MSDFVDFRDLVMSSRRRTEAMAERARANAAFEADQCVKLARGLNLANADVGIPLNEAQRLAQHATDLVRYLSALEAYEVTSVLLEES
jgi:hypothetical protein